MDDKNIGKKYVAVFGEANNWEEAIRLCGKALIDKNYVGSGFVQACIDREKKFPTGLPTVIPVAIPHAASNEVYETAVCVLKLKEPIQFKRMDDSKEQVQTRLIFNLAVKDHNAHVDFLKNMIAFVMDENRVQKCMELSIKEIPNYLQNILA